MSKNENKLIRNRIFKFTTIVVVVWTVLLVSVFYRDLVLYSKVTEDIAIKEARANFNKDEAFRFWAASHGGFYVPITKKTQPNPYLSHVPERDIKTPSGKELTLMNPAYALRQMNEDFAETYGVSGHITSLLPLRPENYPDKWEEKALKSFENGITEVSEFVNFKGEPSLRFMEPLITKKGCLKCHAHQGYKVGDIRGGVSITIPMAGYYSAENETSTKHIFSYLILWVLGFIGIFQSSRIIKKNILEKEYAKEKLQKSYDELESLVDERTNVLVKTNEKLLAEINMRKKAETKIERYSRIFEDSLDEIYLFYSDTLRFTQVNNAAQKNLGYTIEELKKLTPSDLMPQHTSKSFSKLLEPMLNGSMKNTIFETVHQRKDKTLYNVEVHLQLMKYGNNDLFSAIIIDITERKKTEQKLQQANNIINNSQSIAFRWKNLPNWPVEFVSDNVIEIFGYTDEEFKSGKIVYSDLIYKDDLERVTNEVLINSENFESKTFTHKSYRIVSKKGEIIWVEDRTTIIRDEKKEITHYEGFIIDVSRRKEIEENVLFNTEFEKRISNISSYFIKKVNNSINESFPFINEQLSNFLQVDRCYFALLNYTFMNFEIRNEFLYNNSKSASEIYSNLNVDNLKWFHNSMKMGKPLILKNLDEINELDVKEREVLEKLNSKMIIVLPIMVENTLLGFLSFEYLTNKPIILERHLHLFELLLEIINNYYTSYLANVERLRVEEQMRKLNYVVEQSVNCIIITDVNGNIEYVNPKFEELTGYSKLEVLGKNPRILKSGHTSKEEYETLWKTILNGEVWEGELKNLNKDGGSFWERVMISPLKDSDDVITNFIAIKEDITEKIKTENQLALSQKMESVGQLAAGIAHEINTPLQYVGDNASFLADSYNSMFKVFYDFNAFLEDGNDHSNNEIRQFYMDKKEEMDLQFIFEEVPEALKQTKDGIERVSKIVRAMKSFAHPGTKEKALHNLNKGIENTVTISKNEWKYVADLKLNLDKNLPDVYSLQDELNQVFLNMIINAAHAIEEKIGKANSADKGVITIETSQNNGNVIITISDSGKGVKPENLNRIFEPFFTTKDVGKGTGQGLAIVHDIIVNKHNGTVEVSSEYGVGTTFTLTIPTDKPAGEEL